MVTAKTQRSQRNLYPIKFLGFLCVLRVLCGEKGVCFFILRQPPPTSVYICDPFD